YDSMMVVLQNFHRQEEAVLDGDFWYGCLVAVSSFGNKWAQTNMKSIIKHRKKLEAKQME
ncbi:MAG TPA: hypothetical protein K8W09_01170, partial [Parabacteroides johnsonii]|nr:hypothetical protein [Parabacteroides johnsonii]